VLIFRKTAALAAGVTAVLHHISREFDGTKLLNEV
jgi:hypothetical protein